MPLRGHAASEGFFELNIKAVREGVFSEMTSSRKLLDNYNTNIYDNIKLTIIL